MGTKTILLPVYNGIIARNFFWTDVYGALSRDPNVRLIIVIPSSKLAYYRQTFTAPNVIFEPLDAVWESRFGQILSVLAFNLLHTRTVRAKQRGIYVGKYGSYVKFALFRLFHLLLGPFRLPRRIIRWLDRFVPPDPRVAALLERYQPDLVVLPDVVFGVDRVFLRAARRRNIATLGMIRSWDNLTSKGVIQILPDTLLLHTTRLKAQAVRYADMPAERIIVTGPPSYDSFFRPIRVTRDEFCARLGIDPSRRIVLFAPFYSSYTGSAVRMLRELDAAIADGRLPERVQILVRYRPATPEIPPEEIPQRPYISVTRPCSRFFPISGRLMMAKGDWEFTAEDVDLLLHSLYFSDVVVTTVSTLTIDAAVFDKPVIGIRFDADPNTPPIHRSTTITTYHDHYRELEDERAVALVRSIDELIAALRMYLAHPEQDREGRARIVRQQIERTDGHSGMRVADEIRRALLISAPLRQ